MKEQTYKNINFWFREKDSRMKKFLVIYKILPLMVVAAYGVAVFIQFYQAKGDYEKLIRVILVPAVTFILCTIFRKIVNERRPYEVWDLKPLVKKDKKGQSFPSRHMLSATIIAMACFYTNHILGIVMFVLALFVGIVRPIAGVHFVKDIVAALILGILCGIVGFYIIP